MANIPKDYKINKWNWQRDAYGCAPFWMFWDSTSGPVGGAIAAIVIALVAAASVVWGFK